MQEYVGIDLHVRMSEAGEVLQEVRIENDPLALAVAIAEAGPNPEVAIEATYGWYWAADVLEAAGARVHLAHPLGMKVFEHQRLKRDSGDARSLADLLRMDRLPEGWIAPPAARELRELVRYRAKLVALRSGLKAQVHSVLAKEGVRVPMSDLFGEAGTELLESLRLGNAYALRVASLRSLIEIYDEEIHKLNVEIYPHLNDHAGFRATQAIPGVDLVLGAVFVAEIGDHALRAQRRCRYRVLRANAEWTQMIRSALAEASGRPSFCHPSSSIISNMDRRRGARIIATT